MIAGDFSQLAAWMAQQVENIEYGEITARLIVHDGQIRFVEKSIVEKQKCETPADTGAGKN